MITNKPRNIRVRVKSGDGSKDLGEGTYVGDVGVYFIYMPDGSLRSRRNAEEEPKPEEVPEHAQVFHRDGNPKILLDSGDTVYGCQVWWEPIIDPKAIERIDTMVKMIEEAVPGEVCAKDILAFKAVIQFVKNKQAVKMLAKIVIEMEATLNEAIKHVDETVPKTGEPSAPAS